MTKMCFVTCDVCREEGPVASCTVMKQGLQPHGSRWLVPTSGENKWDIFWSRHFSLTSLALSGDVRRCFGRRKDRCHPFFPSTNPQHGDPRSWPLRICKPNNRHVRGWPIPMCFICESFSFIGQVQHENIRFITINHVKTHTEWAADEMWCQDSHSCPIPPGSKRDAPKMPIEMMLWLIVVFPLRIFPPIGRCWEQKIVSSPAFRAWFFPLDSARCAANFCAGLPRYHPPVWLRWNENETEEVGHPLCPTIGKRYGKSRRELP